jgi:hypothetical protein
VITTPMQRDPLLWRCPDCGKNTWPGTDREGRVVARRCITCQIKKDEQS